MQNGNRKHYKRKKRFAFILYNDSLACFTGHHRKYTSENASPSTIARYWQPSAVSPNGRKILPTYANSDLSFNACVFQQGFPRRTAET